MSTSRLIHRLNQVHNIKPHGFYPTDTGKGWRHIDNATIARLYEAYGIRLSSRNVLSDDDAAPMLGWPSNYADIRGSNGGIGVCSLFRNKGFVAICPVSNGNRLYRMSGKCGKDFPIGTLGLYRHDDRFYIIERYESPPERYESPPEGHSDGWPAAGSYLHPATVRFG